MFYIVNVTIYFSFLGNCTQQNCTSFNQSYKQYCLYKQNNYIKYVHVFDVISAHYFPQPLKSEAVLQLFNGEAELLRENRLTVLLLWENKTEIRFIALFKFYSKLS